MKVLSIIVALAVAVSAAPLETRGSITVCTEQDFAGCSDIPVSKDTCWNFPGSLNDVVSSLRTQGKTCTFFTDGSCTGTHWTATGQHPTIPRNLNDQLSSVKCN